VVVTMPRSPAKRSRLKWPGAARDDRTPFERFKDLAGRLVRVPKAEIEKQAEQYRQERAKQTKRR